MLAFDPAACRRPRRTTTRAAAARTRRAGARGDERGGGARSDSHGSLPAGRRLRGVRRAPRLDLPAALIALLLSLPSQTVLRPLYLEKQQQ